MKKSTDINPFADWFRQSSPYIQAHRRRTFVIYMPGESVDDSTFAPLVDDITLLANLGIRVVLVHGTRPQVDRCLKQHGLQSVTHDGLRITDEAAMPCVQQAAGATRVAIEAQFSASLSNSPVPGNHVCVTSGNFIIARPHGVHDGVDFMHTGTVRRVEVNAIRHQLDTGHVVLISPIGYSSTGEVFNLSAKTIAMATAVALSADKLLLLTKEGGLRDGRRRLISQLTTHEADVLLHGRRKLTAAQQTLMRIAIKATELGVRRVHLLNRKHDGALLQELFTRNGVGTLISAEPYDTIRQARADDIPGILQMVEPLEHDGVLVKRPRDTLEMEIGQFQVAVRDGAIIGCAALYAFDKEQVGELACLAMHEDYRNAGGGAQLLKTIERLAQNHGLQRIFVLTTQTAHWFREQGFKPATIDDLPVGRRKLYNYQRRSKVFIKTL